MKKLIYILSMFVFTAAWSQEKPKEVKQETEVKTVKYKGPNATTEKKVKVVKRETADVKLDNKDKKKINQKRVEATKKVEEMVMIDDDDDSDFEILTKETQFINENSNYKFIPNDKGFDIVFDNDKNEFVNIGKAWITGVKGNYIINGDIHNGIGYFDKDGNFIIEYYNEDSNEIESITYLKNNNI